MFVIDYADSIGIESENEIFIANLCGVAVGVGRADLFQTNGRTHATNNTDRLNFVRSCIVAMLLDNRKRTNSLNSIATTLSTLTMPNQLNDTNPQDDTTNIHNFEVQLSYSICLRAA